MRKISKILAVALTVVMTTGAAEFVNAGTKVVTVPCNNQSVSVANSNCSNALLNGTACNKNDISSLLQNIQLNTNCNNGNCDVNLTDCNDGSCILNQLNCNTGNCNLSDLISTNSNCNASTVKGVSGTVKKSIKKNTATKKTSTKKATKNKSTKKSKKTTKSNKKKVKKAKVQKSTKKKTTKKSTTNTTKKEETTTSKSESTTKKTEETTTKKTEETTSKKTNETTTSNVSNSEESQYVQRVVELVNQERAKAGLNKVTLDNTLKNAAMTRAKETVTSFSHTRPNGTSFSTVLAEYNISYRGCGENIAWGQATPEEVMNGWMNSSGHRANILNANYTKIGVGYYKAANGRKYWSQLFTY